MIDGAYLYVLRCSDGAYYVGTTRSSLERRVGEHNAAAFGGWTAKRRPVRLVYQQHFASIVEAVAAERRIKGWRREKKEALIDGRFDLLPELAKAYGKRRQ